MRTPGVASAADAFRNLSPGLVAGFTLGNNTSLYHKGGFRGTLLNTTQQYDDSGNYTGRKWEPQNSIGGVLTSGYGAVGGAIGGAALGAASSNFIEGGNIGSMAVGGAVLGATAAVAAPFAIGAAARGAYNTIASVPKGLTAIGSGVLKGLNALGSSVFSNIGTVANGLTNTVSSAGSFLGAKGVANNLFNPITRGIKGFTGFARSLVKKAPGAENGSIISGYKFSAFGLGVLGATELINGTRKAANTLMNDRMGQRDGYITSLSPSIRMPDNAGATGDLVFALNNNR